MARLYFSNAQNFRSAGLMRKTANSQTTLDDPRLHVIDLPSVKEFRFRAWVVSTILSCEWIRAEQSWESALSEPSKNDRRVPTFIVADEAHNFISAEPRNHSEKGLREQFRRIAAERRKFGLFQIVVSQRPDKLDPLIVSECENRAVMRLGSPAVLSKTAEILGLGSVPEAMLEGCLEFDSGRALLVGPWMATLQFSCTVQSGGPKRAVEI
jgi:DNA helicase HerA-like ATPase